MNKTFDLPPMRDFVLTVGLPENPSDWKDAPATFSGEKLKIMGHPVMESWEDPYMKELAKVATSNGGKVLELGFGMGISARYIQQSEIEEHFIIEANSDVFMKVQEFAGEAKHKVTPLFGFWQDVVGSLPSDRFDGILFDTYPITEQEGRMFYFEFFKEAYRLLKKGGVFTHYCDLVEFTPFYRQQIQETGFSEFSGTFCPVNQPPDCLYWQNNVFLVPKIIK